jgi:hypothetical protein
MMLKIEYFGTDITKSWKILKCVAGEGRKRSVGLIMWEMKRCCVESRRKGKGLNGLVTSDLCAAF